MGVLTYKMYSVRSLAWGTWVAQSVQRPTSAQVMISQFVSSSPVLGFVLTDWALLLQVRVCGVWSLLWILCPPLSLSLSLSLLIVCSLSLSLENK